VKNFPANAMEVRDLGSVYFDFDEYPKVATKTKADKNSQLN